MSYDYQIETKLISKAPELHQIFSDNVLCVQNMLNKYQSVFPNYTDHTVLHSLEVISFCNELIGDNIDSFNTDEIFVLLMAAYLHDSGMGISEKDYRQFSAELPCVQDFIDKNPGCTDDDIIRSNHNEFSGRFIEKYAALFDFPTEEHLFATVQASRGHRKTDLFDEAEYPSEIKLKNGNVIHLPYIAALIRLADEIDIAADRNIQFLYNLSDISSYTSMIEFRKHMAIKRLEFEPDSIIVLIDFSDTQIADELVVLIEKLNATLEYCVNVIEKRTPFLIGQKTVKSVSI